MNTHRHIATAAKLPHGLLKTTVDADMVGELRPDHVAEFCKLLKDAYYASLPAVESALKS